MWITFNLFLTQKILPYIFQSNLHLPLLDMYSPKIQRRQKRDNSQSSRKKKSKQNQQVKRPITPPLGSQHANNLTNPFERKGSVYRFRPDVHLYQERNSSVGNASVIFTKCKAPQFHSTEEEEEGEKNNIWQNLMYSQTLYSPG